LRTEGQRVPRNKLLQEVSFDLSTRVNATVRALSDWSMAVPAPTVGALQHVVRERAAQQVIPWNPTKRDGCGSRLAQSWRQAVPQAGDAPRASLRHSTSRARRCGRQPVDRWRRFV